ncbi:MAG: zinc-binding dehydrogenase [Flavobacteriales bacterium]|nr:zinc-binding dehydrogenase [Flavobacteriales bacterium]
MQAWLLTSHGDPHKAFAFREVPDPQSKSHEILIRVEGFGINFADVMAARGLYREAPPLPSVLGYEVVGRVERAGAAVPGDLLGKRVVALTRFGGYAQLAKADHRACAVIRDAMPLGVAAALATQGCTAWYAARIAYPLRKAQRVLVHSAAGGVGQILVQLALNTGCEVFAVAKGEEKMTHLRAMGAQHVIDRGKGPYAEAVRVALNGALLDVSFNAVGGRTFGQDMRMIGPGGAVVLFGGSQRSAGSGPFATLRFVWDMGVIIPIFLMMKSRSVIGINMLKIADHRPLLAAECLHGAVQAAEQGILRPHVHAVLPATRLGDAHAMLVSGTTLGKVALQW